MLKDKRHEYILKKLNTYKSITINDIANELQYSKTTIRRDFDELSKKGLLKRVHGGAINIENYLHSELSHQEKKIISVKEKEELTDIALKFLDIQENINIFIGPGTTLEIFANKINNPNITVYTNCLPQFRSLLNNGVNVILLGGKYSNINKSFSGDITNKFLEKIIFNIAFFSCNSINGNRIMSSNITSISTQKLAIYNSECKILLADSSKIGKNDFYCFANLEDIDYLVTNKNNQINFNELKKYTNVIF